MTTLDLITREDLEAFKKELFEKLEKLNINNESYKEKQWLRSSEVRKLLKISAGTLQNLRIKGVLKYEKLGGIFYYAHSDIEQLLGEIGRS
ncbi:helix-turn-helix domain-containing protein [Pedobacter ureilyticus]|uniref:Helix-turn-helix domain-containing protein n=1 Tax=Pedobacter ureilyticus TaxID=1393051 RepID=A0ABW9JAX5_9SPHI|nr:helix-turn-helix domain-containing protein [Pedobacter helvus]